MMRRQIQMMTDHRQQQEEKIGSRDPSRGHLYSSSGRSSRAGHHLLMINISLLKNDSSYW
mgnify:CR=1 FL=1